MTYVITTKCVGTKDSSCVAVCPVDAIHPTADERRFTEVEQLYIDPTECIDCDACFEECPVSAIYPEGGVPPEHVDSIASNADFFAEVP